VSCSSIISRQGDRIDDMRIDRNISQRQESLDYAFGYFFVRRRVNLGSSRASRLPEQIPTMARVSHHRFRYVGDRLGLISGGFIQSPRMVFEMVTEFGKFGLRNLFPGSPLFEPPWPTWADSVDCVSRFFLILHLILPPSFKVRMVITPQPRVWSLRISVEQLIWISYPTFLISTAIFWYLGIRSRRKSAVPPKGYRRVGVHTASNISDEYDDHKYAEGVQVGTKASGEPRWRVKALFTYPIKSCAPIELVNSEVGGGLVSHGTANLHGRSY
jgi:hypothetical protein